MSQKKQVHPELLLLDNTLNSQSMKISSLLEIELKWGATTVSDYDRFLKHAQTLGARTSSSKMVSIRDSFFTTSDAFLILAGAKCRLRRIDRRWELTFKGTAVMKNGLAQRKEKTFHLPSFASEPEALKYCRKKILPMILGRRKFVKIFGIKNDRLVTKLTLPDGTEAVASYDQAELYKKSRRIPLQEMELEFLKGRIATFKTFSRDVARWGGLKPSKKSKFSTAVKEFSLERIAPKMPEYRVTKRDSSSSALRKILAKYLTVLKSKEPGVCVGLDDEAVHQMRVSVRRLRTAVRACLLSHSSLEREAATKKILMELKWLGETIGRLRDLEIRASLVSRHKLHLRNVPLQRAQRLETLLSKKIVMQHDHLLAALNSKRYQTLLKSLERLSRIPPKKGPALTVRKTARRFIKKAFKKLGEVACDMNERETRDEDLHRLRMALR